MIKVQSLSLSYDDKKVLDDISFELKKGERLVIMGPSGEGKSTILKCLSGLLTPSSGEIFLNNVPIHLYPHRAPECCGFVFQQPALFDSFFIWENVIFGLRRYQPLSEKTLKEKASHLLELVGLKDVEDLYPSQLSGGMQKRVNLARALALNPQIIFYDEPTSGLDPVAAYHIDELIVNTAKELGMTIIVVTHDLHSASRIADQILFLEKRKINFFGTPEEMLHTSSVTLNKFIALAESTHLLKKEFS